MPDLSQNLRHAIETLASEGFQLSKDAFELVSRMNEEELRRSIRGAIQKANQTSPRPLVITEDFFATQILKTMEPVVTPSVGTPKVPARDIVSQIEVVADATKNITSRGSLDSFVKYFRDRFEKMSMILHERSDVRGARSIAYALDAPSNEKVKFIAMIMGKRERGGKIFLDVDDLENTATVLVL